MAAAQLGQPLAQITHAEGQRRRQPQRAARLHALLHRGGVGFFQLRQHQRSAPRVVQPCLGERQPPRGALDQAGAQLLFQRAEILADHGGGHLQPRRRGDEAAAVVNAVKHP
ncbi:hypothetical protein D3C78_1308280 [compost metagenome]